MRGAILTSKRFKRGSASSGYQQYTVVNRDELVLERITEQFRGMATHEFLRQVEVKSEKSEQTLPVTERSTERDQWSFLVSEVHGCPTL